MRASLRLVVLSAKRFSGGKFGSVLARRPVIAFPPAIEQRLQRLQPVRIARVLIPAQPADAREAHRHAGFVSGRTLEAFERHLEHEAVVACMRDFPHRTEAVDGVGAHEFVDLGEFRIREAEIGFADRNQLVACRTGGPDPEGVIGTSVAPVAVSDFETDSVEGQRARPSGVMRFDLLNVVGSKPARLASPDADSPARAASRSIAVQICARVNMVGLP